MKKKGLALVIVALGLGLFMAMLDGTIVNISIPAMMKDLNTGVSSISWVLDAYLLVLAVISLTMGRLADRFGRKKVYITGVSVFTIASLLCALSWGVGWLIGFRVLQALGAAIMISVSLAIITASFPAEKRGTAMGIWAAVGITAAAVGPTLGGVIVEYLNWNWVFYINVPVGILTIILTIPALTESKDPENKNMDIFGMLVFCISMFIMVLAVIKGEDWGWSSGSIIGFFISAAVFLAIFVLWERWWPQPMLNLRVFKSGTFSSAVICQSLVGFGMIGVMFLLTLFLQNVLGYSALKAAVAITPIPVTALVFSPVAGRLGDKIGMRLPTMFGMAALGLGIWFFSQLSVDTGWGEVAWRAVIVGVGMGISNPVLAAAAMSAVSGGKEGVSSGVINTSRFIGMTLGVAVCTALLTGAVTNQMSDSKGEVSAIVQENQQIPVQAKNIILEQVGHMGEGGNMQVVPDFAALAKEKGMSQELLPQMEQLSTKIVANVKGHITNAFRNTFPWAAGIVLIGIIPACFLKREKNITGK